MVGFDSDDKVSTSSSISKVSGTITRVVRLGIFRGTSITTGVAEMAQGSSSTLSNATTLVTLTQDGNLIGAMFPFSSNIIEG